MKVMHTLTELAANKLIPVRVTVELTARCNLHCAHCYVTHSRKSVLTKPLLTKLFDELQDAGCLFLTFTGGEVGLRSDLCELVNEARKRRFFVTLLSSGSCWGELERSQLARVGVNKVRLSLYSTDATVHDQVTGVTGSHAATMATLHGLRKHHIDVELACTILQHNAEGVADVVAFADKLGVIVAIDSRITLTDELDHAPKATMAAPAAIASVFASQTIQKRFPKTLTTKLDPSSRPCLVGDATFINSAGDVFPCVNWPHSAGNILGTSLLQIFRESEMFEECRALTNRSLGTCFSCHLRGLCTPCPGMNLAESKNVHTPSETVCMTSHARINLK
ncbi:MAG: hypothetical protein A2289_00390 [Deltaproteobacteria bacterium RIFOXYA12_FULL_58_15]|nr:MAG: hypothetical protein A2289_00390 [Deltaproteobacteria bacterium RIFOXYA12_FULL_58_15]OGR12012.1 MAG: hypothetical protein A2341_06780 [Deltaproteobacteria bacterium RIFOXYB12_FULL_58_9]